MTSTSQTLKMERDENYYDYSAIDAPEHLLQALEHFFETEQNPYKFTLPKKHFTALKRDFDFPDANRIFKIITGTTLVTNKTILRYRTAQGLRYMINKEYSQNARRTQRAQRRTKLREITETTPPSNEQVPSKTPPFVQLLEQNRKNPLDYSSDEESNKSQKSISPKETTTGTPSETPKNDTPQLSDQDKDYDDCTIESDVTKQADELEKNLDAAVAQLQADDTTDDDQDVLQEKFSNVMKNLIHNELMQCRQEYKAKEALLDTKILELDQTKAKLMNVIKESQQTHDTMIAQNDRVAKKIQYFTRCVDEFEQKLGKFKSNETEWTGKILQKTEERTREICNDHFENQSPTKNDDREDKIQQTQDTIMRKLSRLKDGTKTLFQQAEDDYDLLSDRVLHVERAIQVIQSNLNDSSSHVPQTPKRRHILSDSDDSQKKTNTQSKFVTPQHHTSSTYQRSYNTSTKPLKQQNILNMDYLRKNVNITCTNQDQILEFYIKFRLAVQKGGIYILPIEDIKKSASIAQTMPHFTSEEYRSQSNALYTLLSNEKFIPSDFTMAQNCILGFASTMDGFSALKAMLKLTHPILNKKRPTNIPPLLSESSDIHAYEQSLRNFYLLHTLYNNVVFTPIEKAKQFIQGMDDDQYAEAVTRIRHQIDTAEALNINLHEDYDIENIASTVINISGEYDNTKAVVRTMNNRRNSRPYPESQSKPTKPFDQRKRTPLNSRFSKTQCHACKKFGHTIQHCTLLPLVLAILKFRSANADKCEHILKRHITNNTVHSKKTFIRVLKNMQVISDDLDSDDYMEDDIIINTLIDNDIIDSDIVDGHDE